MRKGFLVNHNAFSDAHAVSSSVPPPQAKTTTDNYGAAQSMPLAKGDPRYLPTGPTNVAKSKGLKTGRY